MRIKVDDKFILNSAFVLCLSTELLFAYSIFSRLALFAFCLLSLWLSFRTSRIYKNSFVLSYALFTVFSYAIIYLGYAIDKSVATEMTNTLLLNCLFLLSFTQYCGVISDPIEILRVYKNVCIFIAAIMLVLGIPSLLAGGRLGVGGINANAVASFVAYSLIIHLYELYNGKRVEATDVLIIILFSIVLLFTASRKGLLIALIGWYVLSGFKNPKALLKNTLLIVGVSAVVLVIVLNVDFLYNLIGFRLEAVLFFLQGQDFEEVSLVTRNHFMQYAWENSQDSLFFGHGLDCFHTLPKAYGVYSHNNYIEIIFSTGFIGLAIYYSTSFLTLLKIPKLIKCKKQEVCLLLAILIPFLICDFMNVTYFTRRMLIIPAIAIMFLGRYANEKNFSIIRKST